MGNRQIGACAAENLAKFLRGLNKLSEETGIDLDPSWGGVSFIGEILGELQRDNDIYYLDVSGS